jgi:integrase/recombinase XerD
MKVPTRRLEELIAAANNYLLKRSFSPSMIAKYNSEWRKLKTYMTSSCYKAYTRAVGDRYLISLFGDYQRDKLSRNNKQIYLRIQFLTEFQERGAVPKKRKNPDIELSGKTGTVMNAFIATRLALGFCVLTIHSYKRSLNALLQYMGTTGIHSLQAITPIQLVKFVEHHSGEKPATKYCLLSVMRAFFRYLWDEKILATDYSNKIPKSNYTKQPRLPSLYSKEEIEKMLAIVDRGNPKGKRDYAILLLAARLGLRASDICSLKFEHLHWEKCLIVLSQYKTGKRLELPLGQEIGAAIIDYLKYGRPITDEPHVFLHLTPSYEKMTCINLSTITSSYLTLAGVDCRARKHGTHALRHSLAAHLLKNKTPMPVISEVLGHADSKSTMYYLRIDIDSLRQCALEVPAVSVSFYKNALKFF